MGSPPPVQEVETLWHFSGQMKHVPGPGLVIGDVHPQTLGALEDLHSGAVNMLRSVGGLDSPEVSMISRCDSYLALHNSHASVE